MKTKPEKLTDQLRRLVATCGVTRYRISRDTGIPEPTLARLVSGERFVSPDSLDKLGEYLGLRIVMGKPRAKKSR